MRGMEKCEVRGACIYTYMYLLNHSTGRRELRGGICVYVPGRCGAALNSHLSRFSHSLV